MHTITSHGYPNSVPPDKKARRSTFHEVDFTTQTFLKRKVKSKLQIVRYRGQISRRESSTRRHALSCLHYNPPPGNLRVFSKNAWNISRPKPNRSLLALIRGSTGELPLHNRRPEHVQVLPLVECGALPGPRNLLPAGIDVPMASSAA